MAVVSVGMVRRPLGAPRGTQRRPRAARLLRLRQLLRRLLRLLLHISTAPGGCCEAPGGGREAPLSESSQRALRELSERSGGALGELCESSRRLREAAGRRREATERLPEAAAWRRLGEPAGGPLGGPNGPKVPQSAEMGRKSWKQLGTAYCLYSSCQDHAF